MGITQDDSFVYWLAREATHPHQSAQYSINRVPSEGGPSQVLFTIESSAGWIESGAIAVAGDFVYVLGNLKQPSSDVAEVARVPKAGGAPERIGGVQAPDGKWLAVDASNTLYFSQGGALHALLSGEKEPASFGLAAFENAWPKRFAVQNGTFVSSTIVPGVEGPKAVVSAETFAPAYARRTLYRAIVPARFHPDTVAVDNNDAFFAEGGAVMAVPLRGGVPRTVANEPGEVTNILPDGDSLYWTAATSVNAAGRILASRLYRTRKSGGAAAVVVPSLESPPAGVAYASIGKCDIAWTTGEYNADKKQWGSAIFYIPKEKAGEQPQP